jgi:hexosaminidase
VALGTDIRLLKKPNRSYNSGAGALIDGIIGTENYADGKWSGFKGKDLIAEIEFKEAKDIKSLSFAYINSHGAWILPPKSISVYIRKEGESYQLAKEIDLKSLYSETKKIGHVDMEFEGKAIIAIKIQIENYKKLPKDHDYAGEESWLFIDELIIN